MTRTVLLLLALAFAWRPAAAQPSDVERAVSAVLDALHDAASKADFDRYFGLFAENAVFLGTDATERWSVADFKAYAKPIFDRGRGWTYTPTERHVYLARDGQTAWFDEALENANLGETRGTGVLVKEGGTWKIAQYNLTIPIPNALARDVVRQIRAAKQ
ncbi:nuclear transport factor 2 family protein [Rhodocaloribacter sp.]